MEKKTGQVETDNLLTLLFLLMIFSMYLALKLHSLPNYLNGSSLIDRTKRIDGSIIVPLLMSIALIFSAVRTSKKSLKFIFLLSIIPFILTPGLINFVDHLLILTINVLIIFFMILIILRYIIRNYHYENNEPRGPG